MIIWLISLSALTSRQFGVCGLTFGPGEARAKQRFDKAQGSKFRLLSGLLQAEKHLRVHHTMASYEEIKLLIIQPAASHVA